MRFADIPAQAEVKRRLASMADAGRLPHALLLAGAPGAGKLALARALAQYVQCRDRSGGDSCGRCPSCLQHESFNHADMHYVFPTLKRKKESRSISRDYMREWAGFLAASPFASWPAWLEAVEAGNSQPLIPVDEAADMLHVAQMSAMTSPVKVVLLWLPEKLKTEASNKLLKIIEEPWEDTLFIMVSDEPELILPTIYSRLQRVQVPTLSQGEITSMLTEHYGADPRHAASLARLSGGNAAVALQGLARGGEREEFAEWFRSAMRRAYMVDLKALKTLSEQAADMGREKNCRLLAYCADQVRENFLYNLAMPSLLNLSDDEAAFSRGFAPFIHAANVEAIVEDLDAAAHDIERNASAKIVMLDTLLRLIVNIKKQRPN